MKLYNPTKNKISVTIQGVDYTIGAEAELKGIPQVHAEYWKVHLHQFLEISEESNDSEITTKSVKTSESTEKVAEATKTKEKEAAPKKTAPKKTTNKSK